MKHLLPLVVSLTFFAGHANATEYIVRFKNTKSARAFGMLAKSANDAPTTTIPQLNVVVVNADSKSLVELKSYSHDILYISANRKMKIVEANPLAEKQSDAEMLWGMKAINVQNAWKHTKGKGVVVAVSDTGVQWSHRELKPNMWSHPGETGKDANGKDKSTNKKDDDGNGFVDDQMGWDYVSNKRAYLDNHYHGTHVAGTIAAVDGNGVVVGVAPEAKIMVSTFLNSEGSGTEVNGAKTIIYAADNGAKVVNCSWGGDGVSLLITDAILYAQTKGTLVVAAAGNASLDTDKYPQTPATSDAANVISVGATSNKNGDIAGFSNFGLNTVDLSAPGQNINSSANMTFGLKYPYRELSGTSMASPHVAGVAALIFAARPDFTWKQVKEVILASAKSAKDWTNKSITGGILQADVAVELALSK